MKKQNRQQKQEQNDIKNLILETMNPRLSDEQEKFINTALTGKNILVDACIGSGKTTSIQALCNIISDDHNILYLTYNKLLKLDAKDKIINSNVTVTNYHGFVYPYLMRNNIRSSVNESISKFNEVKPKIKKFDILIIDEYQDINVEASKLLEYIKSTNPKMQIIAVGDMAQKIYDFTTLDVEPWIHKFLGNFENIQFTKCFRLGENLASKLSTAWNKPITGVNSSQTVKILDSQEVINYLGTKNPEDIIALGGKYSGSLDVLNELQERFPEKYNKNTIYTSISQYDSNVTPDGSVGIFTTFDSSKGMERPICVVFGFAPNYLESRLSYGSTDPNIIRNIFLVAASRGKNEIIFVKPNTKDFKYLDDNEIYKHLNENIGFISPEEFFDMSIPEPVKPSYQVSTMFDFKYVEDIEDCFNCLDRKQIKLGDSEVLNIKTTDGLLDISPAIGNYVSAAFFKDIDVKSQLDYILIESTSQDNTRKHEYYTRALDWQLTRKFGGFYEDVQTQPHLFRIPVKKGTIYESNFKHSSKDIQWELLVLLAAETGLNSYIQQINKRYISPTDKKLIYNRMSSNLQFTDIHEYPTKISEVERSDLLDYNGNFRGDALHIYGRIDAIHDNMIYELKFVNSLKHIHFLQCAMYMIMEGKETGRLWNIRTNEMWEIKIKDRQKFMDQVIRTITKRNRDYFDGIIPNIK